MTLVLCYHAVTSGWPDRLAVDPGTFERQVASVLRRGYRGAPVDDAVARRRRALHVTFDDAYRSVLDALPLLERLGVPATIFACSSFAEDGRPLDVPELAGEAARHPDALATLDWDGLRAAAERGAEIGSHTVSHPRLTELGEEELARELRESRERIADELRRPCRFLAYPYGDEDRRVRAAARAAGYEAAFALPGRSRPADPFGIPRVGVYRRDALARFTLKTSSLYEPASAALRGLGRTRPSPREVRA